MQKIITGNKHPHNSSAVPNSTTPVNIDSITRIVPNERLGRFLKKSTKSIFLRMITPKTAVGVNMRMPVALTILQSIVVGTGG